MFHNHSYEERKSLLTLDHDGRTRTWWDDWLLLAGLLAMVVGSGLFTELLRLGFARTVLTGEPVSLLLLILDTTQRCALAFTKTSFSLTLLRVFPPGWQRILVLSLLFVLNAYVIVNTIFSWVDICEGELVGWGKREREAPPPLLSPGGSFTMAVPF